MEHSFNLELAEKYGIEEAIILNNLFFWIRKNVANDKHLHDGRYWTYNTNKALSRLFPYISDGKIFRALKHLEDADMIVKGNYNKNKMDRTCWYAFSDNGLKVLSSLGYSINPPFQQNDNNDFSNMKNANCQNGMTIPYINTDINKEDKDKSLSKKEDGVDFEMIKSKWEETNPNLASVRMINDKRKKAIRALLKNNNADVEDLINAFKIISISSFCQGSKGWKASFDWLINNTKNCFIRTLEGDYCQGAYEMSKWDSILKGNDNMDKKENDNLMLEGVEYR